MEQQNQNNTPDGSGDVPQKRKRGRPRKYPRPDSAESSYMQLSQTRKQTPIRAEHAPVPPGFQTVNGNEHLQRGLESEPNDAAVGQVVSGVIEAIFDAGYLLSVRVGNSDTTLRGLVFKTGRFVPVSPENDVAPGVPMIQRNEVPFPSRPTQFHTPLSKEKNGQPGSASRIETLPMNGSQSLPQVPRGAVGSGNLVSSSRTNVPYATGQTADQLARGNVVPILFQPSFLNGMSASTSPVQITPASLAGGVNIVGKEIPVEGNQALNSPAQTSQNLFSSSVQSEGVPSNYQSSSDAFNKNTDKSSVAASMPFEQLVTEGVKRIETQTEAIDTKTANSMSGDNIAAKDPSIMQVDKVNDAGQSVIVEPNSASVSASKAPHCTETGKMTELLQQVLQNNKTENQEAKAAEGGSGDKLDDLRSFGTGFQDGGTVHSTNPF
ncbi:uncharacterized protein LOC131642037 isoform X1 [Vicia villosa]|uniref:uncharacterized protein LOC131642037 isoform X1 n=1 Tax=Vicia villosa TaxID=3911 RepID=UPI00273AC9FA|nr:uncharacterized protein LOC131642037 isoform X1 [Vicia villosa]XP_058768309.1 uncharacterized protein LOC131642037 isoform X1 [Vicia villosa]